MRRYRVSIAGLMFVTLLIPSIAAARSITHFPYWSHGDRRFECFSGVLAMSDVLGVSVLLASRGLWLRGRIEPFLVGFSAFGLLAALLLLGCAVVCPGVAESYFKTIASSTNSMFETNHSLFWRVGRRLHRRANLRLRIRFATVEPFASRRLADPQMQNRFGGRASPGRRLTLGAVGVLVTVGGR